MPFQRIEEPLPGALVLMAQVFYDMRGFFLESYSAQAMEKLGIVTPFVQDNLSFSNHGVVRGLHFQRPPYAQAKLVSVLMGRVLDVVVDLRKDSPTYGKQASVELSEENRLLLYVPAGFAHGFAVLSPQALFSYKCSQYYHPASDAGLRWNDPTLQIDWQVQQPIVSDKDQQLPLWSGFVSPF